METQGAVAWNNLEIGLSRDHRGGLPLITSDRGRVSPGLAVYIRAEHHVCASTQTRRGGGEMNSVRKQLGIQINISSSGRQWIGIAIDERAVGIIGLS